MSSSSSESEKFRLEGKRGRRGAGDDAWLSSVCLDDDATGDLESCRRERLRLAYSGEASSPPVCSASSVGSTVLLIFVDRRREEAFGLDVPLGPAAAVVVRSAPLALPRGAGAVGDSLDLSCPL